MQKQLKAVGSLDFDHALKRAAQMDLENAKYSVEEMALAMSALCGRQVTVQQVLAFASPGPHLMPLSLLPAWVRVTGSRRILDLLQGRI